MNHLLNLFLAPLIAWIITIMYAMVIQPDKQLLIYEYMWILGGLLVGYTIKNVLNVIKNNKS